jgi:DNA uptake protein ComE-like DNA-binding protein
MQAHGLSPGFVMICPFAGGTYEGLDKRWPDFSAFAQHALPALGRPAVLCPGPGEEEEARTAYGAAHVLSGVDLGTCAALMEHCGLMISNDTGPGHLAAAVGTPLLSVLGPTEPGHWGPWGPSVHVERHWPRWPTVDEVLASSRMILAGSGVNGGQGGGGLGSGGLGGDGPAPMQPAHPAAGPHSTSGLTCALLAAGLLAGHSQALAADAPSSSQKFSPAEMARVAQTAQTAPGAIAADGAAPSSTQPAPSSSVDLNQASRAEIEAIGGIGVELADRILQARSQGPFRDIEDLRRRVKGVSKRALQGLAAAGMPVGGHWVLPP